MFVVYLYDIISTMMPVTIIQCIQLFCIVRVWLVQNISSVIQSFYICIKAHMCAVQHTYTNRNDVYLLHTATIAMPPTI